MSIPPVTAPYLAAVALLGCAGVAKAVRPNDTARALAVAGLPGGRRAVRAGAAAEVIVAGAAVSAPGPVTGAAVALAYALFAAYVTIALRRRWPLTSCGCFGRPDTPPTTAHATLDAAAAAAAVWWSASWNGGGIGGLTGLGRVLAHQGWHGGPLLLVTVVIAGLAYLVWTNPLPAARR